MPEATTTDATAENATTTEATVDTTAAPDVAALEAEVAKWKDHARKHEERAKTNAAAVKELDALKQSSMTDIEKAVAAARTEGESAAFKKVAAKVAAAEVKAAAAGRLDDTKLAALLEGIDLGKFVDDDGEVDTEKVARFVDGIAPAPADSSKPVFPDLGQGARGGASATADPLLDGIKAALHLK